MLSLLLKKVLSCTGMGGAHLAGAHLALHNKHFLSNSDQFLECKYKPEVVPVLRSSGEYRLANTKFQCHGVSCASNPWSVMCDLMWDSCLEMGVEVMVGTWKRLSQQVTRELSLEEKNESLGETMREEHFQQREQHRGMGWCYRGETRWLGFDGIKQERWEGFLFLAEKLFSLGSGEPMMVVARK